MKKNVTILLLTASLLLNGCANTASQNPTEKSTEQHEDITTISPYPSEQESFESETTSPSTIATKIEQGGPYGKLSLSIPTGWCYEIYPMDSEKLSYGL